MKPKQIAKDYLYFSKKDRLGILVLIGVGILTYYLPIWFPARANTLLAEHNDILVKAMDTVLAEKEENDAAHYVYEPSYSKPDFAKAELFTFDPNTLDVDGWQRLGLREKTARTIDKYRSKGGKFYKPEDLQKIWGLPDGFYDRVRNYVRISSIEKSYTKNEYNTAQSSFSAVVREERKPVIININQTDTSALIALPGIGSKLAARILNFRDKVGGFYSVDQIRETYGLPDSTFQKLKGRFVTDGEVRKLNVNTATKDELKAHPYIRWQLANAIVEYRNQHGAFGSLEELKKIALIDEGVFTKVVKYLSL